MPPVLLPPRLVASLAVSALVLAACAGDAGSTLLTSGDASLAAPTRGSTAIRTAGPSLTPVPGGATPRAEPGATRIPTTETEWGEIVDWLPRWFPFYPGVGIAEVPEGPLSGSFDAPAGSGAVATWYAETLATLGFDVELSGGLEDGARILDADRTRDACRIRMDFRPEETSTIITVLASSACADGADG